MRLGHPGSPKKSATVIIAGKAGRLGNRLFQGAHFMGNALNRGYRLLNPSLGEYAPYFEGSARDPLCGFPEVWGDQDPEFSAQCRELFFGAAHVAGIATARMRVHGVRGIDIRSSDEAEGGEVDLNGSNFGKLLDEVRYILPMGWKFSDHAAMILHRERISRYFTPVGSVRKPAEDTLVRARGLGHRVIGVHIRQEDYRNWKQGIYYFDTERYARWMRESEECFKGEEVSFVVCSSDRLDFRLFEGLKWVPGPGFPIGDLHALSLCDMIMGPPSTFSQWASYHGDVPLCALQNGAQVINGTDFLRPFGPRSLS